MDKYMYDVVHRFAEAGDVAAMKEIVGDILSLGRYAVTAEQSNLALHYLTWASPRTNISLTRK